MHWSSPLLVALLTSACAATGLPDQTTVVASTAAPVATFAPTTTATLSVPTTSLSPTTTSTSIAPTTTLTTPSTITTVDALTVTTPADWVAVDLLALSPTEAAVSLRPLNSQGLIPQITGFVDAGGIFWAEPADGTGTVTANALQSAPRATEPDLVAEAADIERQLTDDGAPVENFVATELTIGGRPAVRTTFALVGPFGSVDQTQYLYAHDARVYVLTFATQVPERDRVLFASIAESVTFASATP